MSENSQNRTYEAKEAYQNIEQASSYDARRFISFRGKIGDALDKRALTKALSAIPHSGKDALRILDIPCGTGRITQYLLEQGQHVTGADISKEMMQVAEKKVHHFNTFNGFYHMDASALTFDNNTFDAVISIRFIGHIPQDVRIKILKEFARVSQYVVVEYSLKSRTVELRRTIDNIFKTGIRLPKRWGWHIFGKDELYAELEEAGLQAVKMWAKLPYLSDSYYVLMQRTTKSK